MWRERELDTRAGQYNNDEELFSGVRKSGPIVQLVSGKTGREGHPASSSDTYDLPFTLWTSGWLSHLKLVT